MDRLDLDGSVASPAGVQDRGEELRGGHFGARITGDKGLEKKCGTFWGPWEEVIFVLFFFVLRTGWLATSLERGLVRYPFPISSFRSVLLLSRLRSIGLTFFRPCGPDLTLGTFVVCASLSYAVYLKQRAFLSTKVPCLLMRFHP